MEEKISIIVPFYNTEKYLRSCIQSIREQSWKNLEVLLIDDGSGQEPARLCDELAQTFEQMKVVHKKNEGAAAARENGIALAEGKWIFFLDSDDCLDGTDALKILAQRAEETGADITVGNYRKQIGTRLTEKKQQHFFGMEDHRSVRFRFNGFTRDGHLSYEWGKLYRTAFLRKNRIHHTPYPFTQDKAFNMKCCLAGATYAFVDQSVYRYRINPESVTFSYKKKFAKVWIDIAKEFDEALSKLPERERMGDLCATHLLLGLYYYGKQEIASGEASFWKVKRKLNGYMRDPLVTKYAVLYKKERYGKEFGSRFWKLYFDGLALLIRRRWPAAACLLFRFLLLCRVEKRVSENSYRNSAGKKDASDSGMKRGKAGTGHI